MTERAVFTTPGVLRIFLGCDNCKRTIPHYRVYGKDATNGLCVCGCNTFRPKRLPEWQAALWVLVVGWLWRKTLRRKVEWDPRMPMRELT